MKKDYRAGADPNMPAPVRFGAETLTQKLTAKSARSRWPQADVYPFSVREGNLVQSDHADAHA